MRDFSIQFFALFFGLQTAMSSAALADPAPTTQRRPVPPAEARQQQPAAKEESKEEEEYTPKRFSELLARGGECEGKEALLNRFINEIEIPNESGQKVKYKGKLTEKEDQFGDRNFDFDEIQNALFNEAGDQKTKACLFHFNQSAMAEWGSYFSIMNENFKCGMKFEQKKGTELELEVLVPTQISPECQVALGDESVSEYLHRNLKNFAKVQTDYNKKLKEAQRKTAEASAEADSEKQEKSQTQAAIGCTGNNCPSQANENRTSRYIKNAEERACCTTIGERWEILGFSSVKGAKPDDRMCKEMIEKETDTGYCADSYCVNDLGKCAKNFSLAFLRDFFSSVVDSWKFWAWGDQISLLWNEVKASPVDAAIKIFKNITGLDMDYLKCLNRKSQMQAVCQMFGKFAGNAAGFGAGVGAVWGLAKGVGKGALARTRWTKGLATDPKAKMLKQPFIEAINGGTRGFVFGALTPVTGISQAIRVTWGALGKGAKAIVGLPKFATHVLTGKASPLPVLAGQASRSTGNIISTARESSAAVRDRIQALEKRRDELTNNINSSIKEGPKDKPWQRMHDQGTGSGAEVANIRKDKAIEIRAARKERREINEKLKILDREKQRLEKVETAAQQAAEAAAAANRARDTLKKDLIRPGVILGAGTLANPAVPQEGPTDDNKPKSNAAPVPGIGTGIDTKKDAKTPPANQVTPPTRNTAPPSAPQGTSPGGAANSGTGASTNTPAPAVRGATETPAPRTVAPIAAPNGSAPPVQAPPPPPPPL